MTIHNEALLLITSGLWVKALQCYSATVPKYISKGQKYTLYLINIEVFLGLKIPFREL